MRRILEGEAAGLVAAQIQPARYTNLKSIVKKMRSVSKSASAICLVD